MSRHDRWSGEIDVLRTRARTPPSGCRLWQSRPRPAHHHTCLRLERVRHVDDARTRQPRRLPVLLRRRRISDKKDEVNPRKRIRIQLLDECGLVAGGSDSSR